MIAVVASTGSTNADLLAAAREGAPEGTWLRAERQTGGRGRQGRLWDSPAGNLYASTIVRLRAGDPPPPTLALVAGVALHEVVAAHAPGAGLLLKWPNDLVAGGAKLAGILLERSGEAIVIGFGLNLASHPALADRPTTDLAALGGGVARTHDVCLDLAQAVARWLARWRGEGLGVVLGGWLARAHPIGSAVATTGRHGMVTGIFDGLETDGALRLRLPDGSMEIVRAGEVSLV